MKKLMPENYLYWVNKGLSEVDAKTEANKRKGGRYPGSKNYYLLRDDSLSVEKAEELASKWQLNKTIKTRENQIKNKFNGDVDAYDRWKSSNSSLSKANMLKRMTEEKYVEFKVNQGRGLEGNRPSQVEYWTSRGFSDEEAKVQIHNRACRTSKRRAEYWLDKGYTLNEAVIKVSEFQNNTSLDKFIDRYGKDEGLIKYNIWRFASLDKNMRHKSYWINLGYSEEESEIKVSELQTQFSRMSPKTTDYWISEGYSEKNAKIQAHRFASKLSCWSTEFWMDKGLTESEATQKVLEYQKSNSIKGIKSYKHTGRRISSKLEDSVRSFFINKGVSLSSGEIITDTECNTVYYPDIVFDNFIIEVYGDYWHGNPNKYNPEDVIIGDLTVGEKNVKDANRINRLQTITNLPVVIWWESDILKQGLDALYSDLLKRELINENN